MKADLCKKTVVLAAVLFMISSLTLPLTPIDSGQASTTLTVDDDSGEDYQDIQKAVDDASPGDTIFVYDGVYEGEILVNKTLDLEGESKEGAVIGPDGAYGFKIEGDNCSLKNFTVRDVEVGIWIQGDDNDISRCDIVDDQRGVFFDDVDSGVLEDTYIRGGTEGIFTKGSDDISIKDVTAKNQSERSLRLLDCSSSVIRRCDTEGSGYHPLYVSRSRNITLDDSKFNSTGRGVYLYHSENISSIDNHLEHGVNIEGEGLVEWGSHTFINNTVDGGILTYLKDERGITLNGIEGQLIMVNTSRAVVFGSEMADVEAGLIIVNSSDNKVIGNNISGDFEGMKIYDSKDNLIHHNNFANNTRQIFSSDDSSHENRWSDGMGDGNYWDDYEGVDNGSDVRYSNDGVGDTRLAHPEQDHGYGYYSLDPNPLMNRTYPVNRSIYLNKTKSEWHFISTGMVTPFEDHDQLLAGIEEDYDRLMYYSAEEDRWFSYSHGRPEHFNDMPLLNRSMGFWIHLDNSTYLNLSGRSCARTRTKIYPGWNSVGISSGNDASNVTSPEFIDRVGIYNASMEYDIEYYEGDNFTYDPGKGYWIHADGDAAEEWNIVWEG